MHLLNPNSAGISGIAMDPAGTAHVSGNFASILNLDGFALGSGTGSFLPDHIFFAELDAKGTYTWAASWHGAGSNIAATADAEGRPYFLGRMYETADFGSGPLPVFGDWDVFLIKGRPVAP